MNGENPIKKSLEDSIEQLYSEDLKSKRQQVFLFQSRHTDFLKSLLISLGLVGGLLALSSYIYVFKPEIKEKTYNTILYKEPPPAEKVVIRRYEPLPGNKTGTAKGKRLEGIELIAVRKGITLEFAIKLPEGSGNGFYDRFTYSPQIPPAYIPEPTINIASKPIVNEVLPFMERERETKIGEYLGEAVLIWTIQLANGDRVQGWSRIGYIPPEFSGFYQYTYISP
ncbi:hypothetical protein KAX35_00190, partial [candidate division WOR-3 bacterium]|nr:hypothetical protein [candidate division WOR-3 bacterium]